MNIYEEVARFYAQYGGEKCVFGESCEGRPLFALHVGGEGPQLLSQYAIHGREWVTGLLALTHVRRGVPRGGVWVIPLANPDGALISEVGASSLSEERRGSVLALAGKTPLSLWKANAEGVDLNVNFDARWGTGAQNLTRPAPANYIGDAPFSAPESRALRDFTLRIRPAATVSWHTKGEEIYYAFHQPLGRLLRDRKLASVLSESTGYPIAYAKNSAGGYKDWCVEKLKIPAFTVEAGSSRFPHPLSREALPEIVNASLDALWALSEALS